MISFGCLLMLPDVFKAATELVAQCATGLVGDWSGQCWANVANRGYDVVGTLLGFSSILVGSLRDDGFALFAATETAVLLFLSRTIDDPSPNQVAWIMSNPLLMLFSSVDVWLTRFDKAALDRMLPHVPFIRKLADAKLPEKRQLDLEDVSMTNGIRAANLLGSRISARYFLSLAGFVQVIGAVGYALPLADLGGRQSGFDQRGMDILRIATAVYGALSSLVGTMRLLRRPTFTFTSGLFQVTAERMRKPLSSKWTPGVDWLAARVGLMIQCDEEFEFFEYLVQRASLPLFRIRIVE
eukprot:m.271682 g.271682  ORF g.271682 m.271682 type:complete len:297 (-) comp16101_c0_seq8:55-945(-)